VIEKETYDFKLISLSDENKKVFYQIEKRKIFSKKEFVPICYNDGFIKIYSKEKAEKLFHVILNSGVFVKLILRASAQPLQIQNL
jgi:precorrin-3B methylase